RPGWHIECSAMSMKYLGKTFDLHAGGVDLIFPHHENEIAQSESATGKKFVNYFLEGEHLLVEGQKMSKSLGNVFTLRDFEARKINPLAYRYFVLGAHYRSKLNFTWEALGGAERALEKLYEFIKNLKSQELDKKSSPLPDRQAGLPLAPIRSKFNSTLSDDLNTPKALAVVWSLVNSYNKNPDKYDSKEVLKIFYGFDEVLGLGFKNIKHFPIPNAVLALAKEREKFRQQKKWAEADKIRKELRKQGFEIKDTPEGPRLSPVSAL
ncbi:MAG: DALR domain-containing protein, partial [Patescibacteria group bacterium]